MIFNSLPFLFFISSVLLVFYAIPHRFRWVLMLFASYFFYGFWKIEYLSLISISTIIDYSSSRIIYESKKRLTRQLALAISLMTNLGLLFFFKYSNWFLSDLVDVFNLSLVDSANQWRSGLNIILPVGISFYTFQTISYTLDVYSSKIKPEKNIFKFALFVSYFPQLVAGPIERYSRLRNQLFTPIKLSGDNITFGLRLMLYGFFIKMCVADNIAPIVDQIFDQQQNASSAQLFSGMLLFGIQIFSDFHGYSLIAIGTARLFGVKLIDNFNSPYFATSIRDFWNRWHISLSTWFRDYLFIPLGGSRVNHLRLASNILIVFIISGIWHGANWTFVVWGAVHGTAYLAFQWSGLNKSKSLIGWVLTMIIVFLAWVFFRSDNIQSALDYIIRMSEFTEGSLQLVWNPIIASFIGLFLISDFIWQNGNIHSWLETKPSTWRWLIYAFLLYSILAHAGTVSHPFIYFQF
jgi:alginate O-acetyltransferase complex protein AlgI